MSCLHITDSLIVILQGILYLEQVLPLITARPTVRTYSQGVIHPNTIVLPELLTVSDVISEAFVGA